jgi:murein DD-endopeptidase MepM/ murein hydrolase activator NlpD
MMNTDILKASRIAGGLLVLVAAGTAILVAAGQVSLAAPTMQHPGRFLSPPYYGTVQVNVVYDHDLPLMGNEPAQSQGSVTHYDNIQRQENCGTGDARQCYSGHNGIDYALRYELVRAAAPGRVAYAGWHYPADHREGLGLYVRIRHTNDYHTIYGHMSVLRVRTNEDIADSDEFRRILGRSGNTGRCAGWEGTGPDGRCTDNDPPTCGAHLHFELEPPGSTASVNPYGWIGGAGNDPWENWPGGFASHDVWLRYPSITNGDVFPSGAPLTAPPIAENESGYFTIDDGDVDFNETAGCWTVDNTAGWNSDYRRRNIPGGNCTATWNFSQTRQDGRYHVFVHIPNDNVAPGNRRATVDAARYSIRHTPSPSQPWSKQTQIVVVNQWAYPNNAYASTWVYLGAYYFDTNQFGTDYVRLESDTLSSRAGVMAADAVRFAPVVYRTYLPLVLKRWPPIPDTPVLNAIYNPDDGRHLHPARSDQREFQRCDDALLRHGNVVVGDRQGSEHVLLPRESDQLVGR